MRRGPLAIYGILGVFAVAHLGFSTPEAGRVVQFATLIGGFSYLLMAIGIYLSTRPAFLEDAFGGMDAIYKVHKTCGVSAGLLVLAHFFLSPKELPAGVDELVHSLVPSAPLGMISMIALILSLALALNRKIAYHRWRMPHKLMGVVFLLITVHFLTTPEIFVVHFGPSGAILALAGFIGIISYVLNLFGATRRDGKRFVVESVHQLERATEVVLRPLGAALAHRPGQFAFIELQNKKFHEPHPFTISSAPGEENLRFTMKVLGDWTRDIRESLQPGVEAVIRGPYGRFDCAKAGDKQIWLAGGVGITPFLSTLRAMEPGDSREIILVYAVREKGEALYLEEMQDKAKALGNVRIVVLESNEGQFAKVDVMKTKIQGALGDYEYFLCGPGAMVSGLTKGLRAEGVAKSKIHTEAFEFR